VAPRLSGDVRTALILGVTLGVLLATSLFVVACIVWVICRRRRRRQRTAAQTTATDVGTRVYPETTDNRPNEPWLSPRNNEPPYSRYTRDGTLVLTVTNNCTGNGSDVTPFAGCASGTKNGIAASRMSPEKPSVGTISSDVTRFSRAAADDVNVWPYGGADYRQAGTPCDDHWSRKYDEDYRLLRRGSTGSARHDLMQYMNKYPHTTSPSSTEQVQCQSPQGFTYNRYMTNLLCVYNLFTPRLLLYATVGQYAFSLLKS